MMLQAPFPYFGGKSSIADIVWSALGQPVHYIEPFFGSGAVLLQRPYYDQKLHTETINDKDGFIANVWRALQFNPDEVAKWCDWPVNHADLSARKNELIKNEQYLLDNLIVDPKWFDATLAGYWIWAASCWIGSGLTCIGQIPHLVNKGIGVHKVGQRPHLSHRGNGVHGAGKRPHLSGKGMGVHGAGQIPHLADKDKGVRKAYNKNIYEWFNELSNRLRYVRVVCGDWTRVCGGSWQDNIGDVGIFFDPPYSVEDRDTKVYHHDSTAVSQDVADWCIERGKIKSYRIVLAGYFEEHERLLELGWTCHKWKARGGYSSISKSETQGKINCFKEALFFSPYCLNGKTLFD